MLKDKIPKNWKEVSLDEVTVRIAPGGTPSRKNREYWENGKINWLKISDLKQGIIKKSEEKITELGLKKSAAKLFPKDTVLLSIIGTLGRVGILDTSASHSQSIVSMEADKEIILPKYLYYFLKSSELLIQRQSEKGTHPNINTKTVKKIKIRFGSLENQKKIVHLLDKVEKVVNTKKQISELCDQLINSVFEYLFGNPLTNPKNWNQYTLNEICHVMYRYPTFYGFDYVAKGVPVVKIGRMKKDGLVDDELSNYTFIPHELSMKFPKTHVELHDIVLAVVGDGSAGKVGLVLSKKLVGAITSANLLRIKANDEKVDPIFLFYLLNSTGGQRLIEPLIQRNSKKRITTRDLKNLKLPIPPLQQQKEFSEKVFKLKNIVDKNLEFGERTNNLQSSVMKKIFREYLIT